MALIQSAQTGYWDEGSTWIGGVVPNLSVDDVQINDGCMVTIRDVRIVPENRSIVVTTGGTLSVNDGLIMNGFMTVFGWLTVYGYMSVTGSLEVHGGIDVSGSLDMYGLMDLHGVMNMYSGFIFTGGSLNVCGFLFTDGGEFGNSGLLTVNGLLNICNGTFFNADSIGRIDVNGDFQIDASSYIIFVGDPTISFSRRERTIISGMDGHRIIDFTRAYGFAGRPSYLGA